jgi:hypothetical protein
VHDGDAEFVAVHTVEQLVAEWLEYDVEHEEA